MPVRRLAHVIAAGMMISSLPLLAPAAFEWDSYLPGTLAQVLSIHGDEVRPADRVINTAEEKYRVRATYLGERRPVPEPVRALIADWVAAIGADERIAAWFAHEIHVAEAERTYWLPAQGVLLPHMERELFAGSAVELYVMWIGYAHGRWVFLVNEFQKVPAP